MMKKSVLFLVFVAYSLSLTKAQEKGYEFYNYRIDSLVQVYSINNILRYSDIRKDLNFLEESNNNLTIEEKYKLIDKAKKLFDQREYFTLYNFSSVLLDYWKDKFKEPEVRRYITEILLDRFFYYYEGTPFNVFSSYKELTPHSLNRLKVIMQGTRTTEEVENLYWYYKKTTGASTTEVEDIMKTTGRKGEDVKSFLLDSLIQEKVEKLVQKALLGIDTRWIREVGCSNDTTFIPVIKSLIEKYPEECKYVGTYALAKLGDKKSMEDILTNYENVDFWYLSTEEAMWRYLEQNYNWTEPVKLPYGYMMFNRNFPKALQSIWNVHEFIKNVPEEVRIRFGVYDFYSASFGADFDFKDYDPEQDEKNQKYYETIKRFYQWLIDNKGKIEFKERSY